MTVDHTFLWVAVFIATTVEMVEALTIVLALGITRGWRSVLLATGAAIVTLAIVVVIFNAAISQVTDDKFLPLLPLWSVVGGLLLIFGLQWMKKAVLRIGGVLPTRDEDEIYQRVVRDAKKTKKTKQAIDWYSFVLAFKGVLLEGFEVIFIVVFFGSARGEIGISISATICALLFVTVLGLVIHRPLSRVPENWMKLTVGLLLVTFGTYFSSQGAGIVWPLGEWALLYLLAFYIAFVALAISFIRARDEPAATVVSS